MSRFLDLDAVVRSDLEVQIGGAKYRLPGSISTPRMLRWMAFDERQEKAVKDQDFDAVVALMRERYDDLIDLFRIRQPDIEDVEIDQEQMQTLFQTLLGAYQEDDADPPTATPTPKPKNSKRSSRPGTASRS